MATPVPKADPKHELHPGVKEIMETVSYPDEPVEDKDILCAETEADQDDE